MCVCVCMCAVTCPRLVPLVDSHGCFRCLRPYHARVHSACFRRPRWDDGDCDSVAGHAALPHLPGGKRYKIPSPVVTPRQSMTTQAMFAMPRAGASPTDADHDSEAHKGGSEGEGGQDGAKEEEHVHMSSL